MSINNAIVDVVDVGDSIFRHFISKALYVATESIDNWPDLSNAVKTTVIAFIGGSKSIAFSLVVLFFLIGLTKSAITFQEMKRPEFAFSLGLLFVFAVWLVNNCYTIIIDIYRVCQGMASRLISAYGWAGTEASFRGGILSSDTEEEIADLKTKEACLTFCPALIG